MANARMIGNGELLRGAGGPHANVDRTDGQLLDDFIRRRSQAAVAALVYRHGPMVWGVCRRVLGSHHEAEDAFQATFLVLARKAESVIPREMVANWLYGVARQTARKARALAARRAVRERQVKSMPDPPSRDKDLWRDLRPVLDEELGRLPDKYRFVLVFCDLEGRTRGEVARALCCPEGTVAGRLARARQILARRLSRRGVAVTGALLASLLWHNTASARVPHQVMADTVRTVGLRPFGQTEFLSAKVAALVMAVLHGRLPSALTVAVVVTLATLALVAALGSLVSMRPEGRAVSTSPETTSARVTDLRFLGSWQVVEVQIGGQSLSPSIARTFGPWSFGTYQFSNAGRELTSSGSFTLDRQSPLKQITFSPTSPTTSFKPGQPVLGEGIYRFDGDTLILCLPAPQQGPPRRPAQFVSLPGDHGTALLTLKRNGPRLNLCYDED